MQYFSTTFIALLFAPATLSSRASDVGADTTAQEVAADAALYEDFCAQGHGGEMNDPGDGSFDLRTLPGVS